ncbi:hypothetical protein FACS1894216_22080 [Synergistales bacterium]|nr:hypothetical protein FACS1894216_22080 [Synergistales bacterium]
MYKGNGSTAAFPLPGGADGTEVWLLAGGAGTRLKQDDAYRITDGSVVFAYPPPGGTEITFKAPEDGGGKAGGGMPPLQVLYPDGTVREVGEDPYELLLEAKAEREEARKLLVKALDAAGRLEKTAAKQCLEIGGKLSAFSKKYTDEINEAEKEAAARVKAAGEYEAKLFRQTARETRELSDSALREIQGAKDAIGKETRDAAENAARLAAKGVSDDCASAADAARETGALLKRASDLFEGVQNAIREWRTDALTEITVKTHSFIQGAEAIRDEIERAIGGSAGIRGGSEAGEREGPFFDEEVTAYAVEGLRRRHKGIGTILKRERGGVKHGL